MQRSEGTFQGYAGLELYYQSWIPTGKPKTVLVIVHGVAEYSDRYQNLVDILVPENFAIYTFDQRGHGRSPGQRGFIESWQEYRVDFQCFLQLVHDAHPGLPVFAYGHSQGALIILDLLVNGSNNLGGVIVSGSPLATSDSASPLLVATAKMLSRIWPTFSLDSPINPAQLSCDARVVQKYQDDPEIFKILTARWGTEYLKTQEEVRRNSSRISNPIFIIHGGEDKLCDPQGSQFLYEHVSSPDKTIKIYPSYFHEIHNEPGHITVIQDIDDWISARVDSNEETGS